MTMTFEEPTTTADLRLTPIGPGEWLIHDVRYTPDNPACLVAFVREEAGKEADVVWLGPLTPPGSFPSADAVLRAAVAVAG